MQLIAGEYRGEGHGVRADGRRRDGKRGEGEPVIVLVRLQVGEGEQQKAQQPLRLGEGGAARDVLSDSPAGFLQELPLVPIVHELFHRVGVAKRARHHAARRRRHRERSQGSGAVARRRKRVHGKAYGRGDALTLGARETAANVDGVVVQPEDIQLAPA